MVVAFDNADPTDPGNIHPKNKQDIGKRLSLIARAKVYGENIPYSGHLLGGGGGW
jgi:sialate O-acetylesterase